MTSAPISSELLLSARDRVMVFAPHPDDESIATGGLLLAARDAGAARRVVVVTDGDNNPWPQRWVEKRWRIDAAARARWGARRRAEAQAALSVLGVDAAERRFLGLPDTALTSLLMQGASDMPQCLAAQIDEFRPTHVALPILEDRHPDHSALHVALRVAMDRAQPQCLTYSVHGFASAAEARVIELSAEQRQEKQRAILQHETQMRLSRSRFLEFARETESFLPLMSARRSGGDYPLRACFASASELRVSVDPSGLRDANRALHLLILIETVDSGMLRWRLPLAAAGAQADLHDLSSNRVVSSVRWQREGENSIAMLPTAAQVRPRQGFVKLVRNRAGLVVYDRYGWQIIENAHREFGQT